ncbi:hypothetical protein UVI_02062680 [Ustilaginoidea virens]|uniref:UV-endonuclease UVE-1 n=1 Tax=Ustilaginoidea virens TaxID=1159556 RepID=A0A1B5LAN2_USTVR|nr:hypothetical protein UVI_02062680 [Ustilaginoidea virens]
MPPKRKRIEQHPTPPPPPPPPPERLRRSSRRTKEDDAASRNRSPRGGVLCSREAVERAMHTLSEMEHRLLEDAKKQRLAIESSDLWDVTAKEVAKQDEKQVAKQNARPEARQGFRREAKLEATQDAEEAAAARIVMLNSSKKRPPLRNGTNGSSMSVKTVEAEPDSQADADLLDDEPEHPTKNRRDKTKEPDVERGLKYVQDLGLANARDIEKMIRWNERYGIKFMRLSSEMFPFASHEEYGYNLAFAAEVLARAGKVATELNHRLTTHPGQFTQIGSPRREVVAASIRDLEYHDEMLSRLCLSEQLDRDAVMILHMGGTYGDKEATLDRFRENYRNLSAGVRKRLVLENDDVSWSVHDLLPICEELDIPLVLDFHHHNIVFDSSMREGTLDIMSLYDRIKATWTRKNITQKMHYSEPTPSAITPRDRRKHSPRVKTLPPCPADMDLMIEAKDKEQAVFDLMRNFKLPGWQLFNNIIPYERDDQPRKAVKKKKKKARKGVRTRTGEDGSLAEEEIETPEQVVAPEDVSMGGAEGRVYWPEGMEEWLKPKKRDVAKKCIKIDEE